MCRDHPPVSLGAVYELADSTLVSQISSFPSTLHSAIQRQVRCMRDPHRQTRQEVNANRHLKGFQAEPLQSVVHQESSQLQQSLKISRLRTAISPKVWPACLRCANVQRGMYSLSEHYQ